MQEYRAYIIGPDGRITSRVEFLCEDDEAAHVELWQFGRGRDVPAQACRITREFGLAIERFGAPGVS